MSIRLIPQEFGASFVPVYLKSSLSGRALARPAVLPLSLTRHLPPAGGSLSYQGSQIEEFSRFPS